MTAPKLTKAQREMLIDAASYDEVPSGFCFHRHSTAAALERMGLVFKRPGTLKPCNGNRSFTQRWIITDAGRAALRDGAK